MRVNGVKYSKAFITRVKAIHANHGAYMVGLFCALCHVRIAHAITIINSI